jgi:hypothetical protein
LYVAKKAFSEAEKASTVTEKVFSETQKVANAGGLRTSQGEEAGALRAQPPHKLVVGLQGAYGVDSLEFLGFGLPPRLPKKRNRLTQAQQAEKERLEALEKAAAEAGLKV